MTLPPHRHLAGVALLEGFVSEPERLLVQLQRTIAWDTRMRARLTASFGAPYDYSGITYPPVPLLPELDALARRIEREAHHALTNCLINFYPDGESQMGFHSDSYARLPPQSTVCIVSLGGPRILRFRDKPARTRFVDVPLASGSLLLMAARVQEEWMHALPSEPGASPRMSLTFRQVV